MGKQGTLRGCCTDSWACVGLAVMIGQLVFPLCRSAFLLCIIFNIVLQYGVRVLGEENIEIAVDAMLKSALPF